MSKRKFPCPYCDRKFRTAGEGVLHAEACILQNLTPEPHMETGGRPYQDFMRDSVTENFNGGEDCTVRESVVEFLGAGFGEWCGIVREARPEFCPKCGQGSAGIYLDHLTEEWTCVICGWHSGSKPAVPVIDEPAWPHQRAWTHKE